MLSDPWHQPEYARKRRYIRLNQGTKKGIPMAEATEIDKQRLQWLHGVMRLMTQAATVAEHCGETVDPTMIRQPIFEEFRKILKDIPNIDSDEDFKRFALRSEIDSEVWASSVLSMGNTLRNNLPVQHLVDQMVHDPREMKPSLLEVTDGKFDPEILAPILSMYSLLDSDAVDPEKLTDWHKNSGNVFGLARYEGGKAEVSAVGKKAVKIRIAQDPTKPLKDKIEQHWIDALKVKGSDNGIKTHFVKRMQELVKTDGKGITVPDRTINDWTHKWGGKLQKIDKPRKRP